MSSIPELDQLHLNAMRCLQDQIHALYRYSPEWKLETIPDEVLHAEVARRRALKREYKRSCECGECPTCKNRLTVAKYRRNKKAPAV